MDIQNLIHIRGGRLALTYDEYIAQWEPKRTVSLKGLDRIQRKYVFYSRYNWDRHGRVEEAYRMSNTMRAAVAEIDAPQLWLVITEDWCADSAYSLPVIKAAADMSPHVTLRLAPRDVNPELMDRYLSNGARSIPRLVVADAAGDDRFVWGPAPAPLQQLKAGWKAEEMPGEQQSALKIEWYEAEGWAHVDAELAALMAAAPAPVR